MIASGQLLQPITFYSATVTQDFAGATSGTYSVFLKTRANVGPMVGRRAMENGQKEDVKAVLFIIRWRKDVNLTTDLLLVYRNLPYTIYSIVDTNNERKEFQILARAKEGLTAIPLATGGTMEFRNNFKTQMG